RSFFEPMTKLKDRWEIQKDWQLLFPILGSLLSFFAAYLIVRGILSLVGPEGMGLYWPQVLGLSLVGYFGIVRICLWCFKKLEHRWPVDHKWEMIAIFIVFAITGSLSGKLAGPLVDWLGLGLDQVGPWLHWPARLILILPIYQLILVLVC